LTVNGAVNAGPQKVRLDDNASGGTINGSGTIQLKGQGQLLVVQGTKTLTLDGVTLAGVADNNEPLVGVNGGALVMKSGAITGNTHIRDEGAGGGGVGVWEGGAFTMEGGTISGNTAESDGWSEGGGVEVEDGGTFTMKDGAISGNTAKGGVGTNHGSGGGGVKVGEDSTFTMEGGEISGNTAESGEWSDGGGVRVRMGTFIMKGGTISGNTATAKGDSGGGVAIARDGVFTLKGGTIYGKIGSLPAGVDPGFANIASNTVALSMVDGTTANWGTGGTYIKGIEPQTGGTNIGGTDETLIAIPAN
jgi:hypothetical protein